MDEDIPPPYNEDDAGRVEEKKHIEDDESPPYSDRRDAALELTTFASASSSTSAAYGKRGPRLNSITIDSSKPLKPTRTFWIPWFTIFTKTLKVYDISSSMSTHWEGAVNKEYRELAKAMFDKYQKASDRPAYSATSTGVFRHRYSVKDASGSEVCAWKHGWTSMAEVDWVFPAQSSHIHSAAETKTTVRRANKLLTRDRIFVINDTMYAVEMDSTWRSNQWTIFKLVANLKVPVARYGMRYSGAWFVGGCAVVDGDAIDEALAVITCLVILKQNKQRAAERSQRAGGGGS